MGALVPTHVDVAVPRPTYVALKVEAYPVELEATELAVESRPDGSTMKPLVVAPGIQCHVFGVTAFLDLTGPREETESNPRISVFT